MVERTLPNFLLSQLDIGVDDCKDNKKCLNGATCRDKDNDYQCVCAPGWQGRHCETSMTMLYIVTCLPCSSLLRLRSWISV